MLPQCVPHTFLSLQHVAASCPCNMDPSCRPALTLVKICFSHDNLFTGKTFLVCFALTTRRKSERRLNTSLKRQLSNFSKMVNLPYRLSAVSLPHRPSTRVSSAADTLYPSRPFFRNSQNKLLAQL